MTEGDDMPHHLTPSVDALSAAVRLDAATAAMRARQLEHGPELLDDEPPTGLLDLAAIRAAVAAGPPTGELDVDPAAAAWLAGGPDPAAARLVERVDQLEHRDDDEPTPREWLDAADKLAEVRPELVEGFLHVALEHLEPRVDVDEQPVAQLEPSPSPEPTSAAPVVVTPPSPPTSAPSSVPRVFSSEHEPRPGWSSRHDPRSLAYTVREHLGAAPLQDVDLPIGPVLDQGQEGECVGCGTVDAVNVLRLLAGRRDLLKIDAAAGLYHRAQQLDAIPGEAYTGTSVLAGMKAATEAGLIGSYLWALGTRQIAAALAHGRPVVVGIPWLSGMYDTGPGGLVEVKGDDRGEGHCLAVVKLRLKGPQGQPGPWFGWLNSWGRSYGDGGIGWVHHRDLAGLLRGVGEAAVPAL